LSEDYIVSIYVYINHDVLMGRFVTLCSCELQSYSDVTVMEILNYAVSV